ncbi:hypothetical protein ACKVEX_01520 [Rhodocyclaceae bacterium SMB388]
MKRSASTLLAALCMLLAAALAARWIGAERVWTPPAPQASPDTLFLSLAPGVTDPPATADVMPDALAEIAARPLFNPGRRPAAPGSTPASAATPADIALVGVFSTESAGGAILMIDGAATRVRTGERVGGLILLAVDDTHARFVADDGSGFELALQRRVLPQAPDAYEGPAQADVPDADENEAD